MPITLDRYVAGEDSPNIPETVLEMFPRIGPIHASMWWLTQETDAPPAFLLAAQYPCIAHEAATRGWVIGEEERLVPRVWIALIGDASSRKSHALRKASLGYRYYLAKRMGDLYADPFQGVEGTPQGLLGSLMMRTDPATGKTYAILWTEEMVVLLEHDKKINEYAINIRDGVSIERHTLQLQKERKESGNAADILRSPVVQAMFASTAANLQRVMQRHHIEGGLFSRILWITDKLKPEDKQPWLRHHESQMLQALEEWQTWGASLDGLEMRLEHERQLAQDDEYARANLEGRPARVVAPARVVIMPQEVKDLYLTRWFKKWEQYPLGHGRLEATINRGGEQVRTIAGLNALMRGSNVISEDDLMCAIAFVERAIAGAKELDMLVAGTDEFQLRRQAFDELTKAGPRGLKQDELQDALKVGYRQIKELLAGLLSADTVTEVVRKEKRGRPPKYYVLSKYTTPKEASETSEEPSNVISLHIPQQST